MTAFENWQAACPECGETEQIDVVAEVWVRLVHDGTDTTASHIDDHHFDGDSLTHCNVCQHRAKFALFLQAGEKKAQATIDQVPQPT